MCMCVVQHVHYGIVSFLKALFTMDAQGQFIKPLDEQQFMHLQDQYAIGVSVYCVYMYILYTVHLHQAFSLV